jgi:hypothetical protein
MSHPCRPRSPHHGGLLVAGLILAIAGLGGCVANSSNPVVSTRSARMRPDRAEITLNLANPGGRNLTIQRVEYELSHGEMGLPVAQGAWSGALDLPASGDANLALLIPFTIEPIEADSTLLHLNGLLHMKDHTGFLGMSSMDLTRTPFQLDIEAEEADP